MSSSRRPFSEWDDPPGALAYATSAQRAFSIQVPARISIAPINGEQQQTDFRLGRKKRSGFVLRGAEMHFRSGPDSLLAQQDHRIERQGALRRNPGSRQPERCHSQNHSSEHKRIARRCLIDDGRQHPAC